VWKFDCVVYFYSFILLRLTFFLSLLAICFFIFHAKGATELKSFFKYILCHKVGYWRCKKPIGIIWSFSCWQSTRLTNQPEFEECQRQSLWNILGHIPSKQYCQSSKVQYQRHALFQSYHKRKERAWKGEINYEEEFCPFFYTFSIPPTQNGKKGHKNVLKSLDLKSIILKNG